MRVLILTLALMPSTILTIVSCSCSSAQTLRSSTFWGKILGIITDELTVPSSELHPELESLPSTIASAIHSNFPAISEDLVNKVVAAVKARAVAGNQAAVLSWMVEWCKNTGLHKLTGYRQQRLNTTMISLLGTTLEAQPDPAACIALLPGLLLLVFTAAASPNTLLAHLRLIINMTHPIIDHAKAQNGTQLGDVVDGSIFQHLLDSITAHELRSPCTVHALAWLLPELQSAQQKIVLHELPRWLKVCDSDLPTR